MGVACHFTLLRLKIHASPLRWYPLAWGNQHSSGCCQFILSNSFKVAFVWLSKGAGSGACYEFVTSDNGWPIESSLLLKHVEQKCYHQTGILAGSLLMFLSTGTKKLLMFALYMKADNVLPSLPYCLYEELWEWSGRQSCTDVPLTGVGEAFSPSAF